MVKVKNLKEKQAMEKKTKAKDEFNNPIITGDTDTDELLEDERLAQLGAEDVTSIMSQVLEITKLLDERIDLMKERIDLVSTRVDTVTDIIKSVNAKLTKVAGRLGI